jgi:hypothetical protein
MEDARPYSRNFKVEKMKFGGLIGSLFLLLLGVCLM